MAITCLEIEEIATDSKWQPPQFDGRLWLDTKTLADTDWCWMTWSTITHYRNSRWPQQNRKWKNFEWQVKSRFHSNPHNFYHIQLKKCTVNSAPHRATTEIKDGVHQARSGNKKTFGMQKCTAFQLLPSSFSAFSIEYDTVYFVRHYRHCQTFGPCLIWMQPHCNRLESMNDYRTNYR